MCDAAHTVWPYKAIENSYKGRLLLLKNETFARKWNGKMPIIFNGEKISDAGCCEGCS